MLLLNSLFSGEVLPGKVFYYEINMSRMNKNLKNITLR